MKLPSLLPKELHYFSAAASDRELFQMMIKSPSELVEFFVNACDDETWCLEHNKFMENILEWLTRRAFEEKLLYEKIQKCADAIQRHYSVLENVLPKNIICIAEDREIPINGLLLAAASRSFSEALRRECREKNSKRLQIPLISASIFMDFHEFIRTGNVQELWQKDRAEILEELKHARQWELEKLAAICEDLLKRDVDQDNVIENLKLAMKEHLVDLRKSCYDQLNRMDRGLVFHESDLKEIHVEFLNFRDNALDLFEKVRQQVTHLAFGSNLTEEKEFSRLIHSCPRLIGLDLHNSESFSEYFETIPSDLKELDLSMCVWLDERTLSQMISFSPNLLSLRLASNVQLKYTAWSHLRRLNRLEKLDLTRCSQITNEEFQMIVQACRGLMELTLESCTKLTDVAFAEIPKCMPDLTHLNLSRTGVGDVPLIETAMRCRRLRKLDLSRCPYVTDKGLMEILEAASSLRHLKLVRGNLLNSTISLLKEKYPHLEIEI